MLTLEGRMEGAAPLKGLQSRLQRGGCLGVQLPSHRLDGINALPDTFRPFPSVDALGCLPQVFCATTEACITKRLHRF